MNRRRLFAMFWKECLQIGRDPSTFMIAFLLPVLLIFLFGYGVSLDTGRSRIGLSLQDDSEAAISLAAAFRNSRYFDVYQTGSTAELGMAVARGSIRGYVVIPRDFGKAAITGGGTIQVITDGTQPNTASFIAGYASGLRSDWAATRAAERGVAISPLISVLPRFWFNPELASRFFLVPGAIAIVMTMIGSLLTGLVVAREWERGTMEAILATPLGMAEFITVKVVPYFFLGLVSMAICAILGVTLFGVPFRGSIFALLVISSCFLVPALGQGLFISSATKNQFVASQIAMLSGFMPATMLSGFLFEISSMPKWVQALTYIVPARYLIPQLQTVFVAGDNWAMFLTNCFILLCFGALFFGLSLRVTRRRIA
jgi:ABC-2 type transport system permease protein